MYQTIVSVALLGTMVFGDTPPASRPAGPVDVRLSGVFGFPQKQAEVLCDTDDLRVSAWNDAKYLYVQAVLWKDGDSSLGETPDGRPIGDSSSLCLDLDGDEKITGKVDRDYSLDPWPRLPGLRYSVWLSSNASTHIMSDSKGRGSIRYVETPSGQRVRVDGYLIPLAEIDKKPGDELCLAYRASSEKPELKVNSIGAKGPNPYALPKDKYHKLKLQDRAAALDPKQVPEGREDPVPATTRPTKPAPKVGSVPPEIKAKDWLNTDKPPTLAGLHGKVVVIDFWATWCGPCVAGIPHLNDLHAKYESKGLRILGITDQSRKGIENFMKGTPMKYIVGAGSDMAPEYGVSGFPHAYIIGRDGKLVWEGFPSPEELDKQVTAALEAK